MCSRDIAVIEQDKPALQTDMFTVWRAAWARKSMWTTSEGARKRREGMSVIWLYSGASCTPLGAHRIRVIIGIICQYISTNLDIWARTDKKVLQIMVSIMNTKFRGGKECQGLRDVLCPHILVLFHGHQMGSCGEDGQGTDLWALLFAWAHHCQSGRRMGRGVRR